jgi:hypothetical protein
LRVGNGMSMAERIRGTSKPSKRPMSAGGTERKQCRRIVCSDSPDWRKSARFAGVNAPE